MKKHFLLCAVLAAMVLAIAGCTKEGSVDTVAFESAFKDAEASVQTSVKEAAASVKSANYSAAVTQLHKLADQAKLTPAQQQAVKDLVAQVQQALTDTGKKVADDAGKAAQDLQKSLPK